MIGAGDPTGTPESAALAEHHDRVKDLHLRELSPRTRIGRLVCVSAPVTCWWITLSIGAPRRPCGCW